MVFLGRRVDAIRYCRVLRDLPLPWATILRGETWTFQQNNALVHTAGLTARFLIDSNVDVLSRPACSPDFSPIENVWSVLARKVYANSRQILSKDELKSVIVDL